MNNEWVWIIGGLAVLWLLWPSPSGRAAQDVSRVPPQSGPTVIGNHNPIEAAIDLLYEENIKKRKQTVRRELETYADRRFEPIASAKATLPEQHEAAALANPKPPVPNA